MIALAGNKSDLANLRAVKYKEANGYAEENGLLFMETSAKNANNVDEVQNSWNFNFMFLEVFSLS